MKLRFPLVILGCGFIAACGAKHPGQGNGIPPVTEFKPLAAAPGAFVRGQLVYVPIYSSIYHRHDKGMFHLTAVLSVRNTSETTRVIVSRVDYYDTNGKLLRRFIDTPHALGPYATVDFVIPEQDLAGGTGANFVVRWDAERAVSTPLIEAVMLGSLGTQGYSFTSRGQVVEPH